MRLVAGKIGRTRVKLGVEPTTDVPFETVELGGDERHDDDHGEGVVSRGAVIDEGCIRADRTADEPLQPREKEGIGGEENPAKEDETGEQGPSSPVPRYSQGGFGVMSRE